AAAGPACRGDDCPPGNAPHHAGRRAGAGTAAASAATAAAATGRYRRVDHGGGTSVHCGAGIGAVVRQPRGLDRRAGNTIEVPDAVAAGERCKRADHAAGGAGRPHDARSAAGAAVLCLSRWGCRNQRGGNRDYRGGNCGYGGGGAGADARATDAEVWGGGSGRAGWARQRAAAADAAGAARRRSRHRHATCAVRGLAAAAAIEEGRANGDGCRHGGGHGGGNGGGSCRGGGCGGASSGIAGSDSGG
ncbi:unnamed protein product, partial [Phaeothamnion confervicola]